MDLINTGTDPWILEHDACERVAREIMEHLNSRDSEKTSSQVYEALSAKIRIRLKQFATEVNELNKKLNLASVVSTLTPEERERRQRQVEVLQSKEVQLREHFSQRKKHGPISSAYNESRSQLFEKKGQKSAFADMGTTSWADIEGSSSNQEIDNRSIDQMKQEQERLLEEQDKGLESLLKIVTAQTQIAHSIHNEVEHHNDILVDIAEGMDRVDTKINSASDMVKIITKKESIWGYWLVAFLLLIAILGVGLS